MTTPFINCHTELLIEEYADQFDAFLDAGLGDQDWSGEGYDAPPEAPRDADDYVTGWRG